MITKEADYAVRAVLFLAKSEGSDKPMSSAELAKEMNIPYRFMRRIGLKLQKSGFIKSRKGKGGGIRLARPSAQISVLDIVKAFDESGLKLNSCLKDAGLCVRSDECSVHKEMVKLQAILEGHLGGLTFEKLL